MSLKNQAADLVELDANFKTEDDGAAARQSHRRAPAVAGAWD
jgi:hypothetical protein